MATLSIAALDAIGVTSAAIVAELTDANHVPVAGRTADGTIVKRWTGKTNALGLITLDLEPNANISPANTYWTVWVGGFAFLIEKSAAAQTLAEAEVVSPADLGSAAVLSTDYRLTNSRDPLPVDSRLLVLGHSIVIGTGSTLTGGPFTGDSRQARGSWFSRLCGQHPDRYFPIRNAGIGGDIIGGLGHLTLPASIGDRYVTLDVAWGMAPWNGSIGLYVGGYGAADADAFGFDAVANNGDGTYTVHLLAPLAHDHAAGAEVGWGMHGRLQATVLDYAPGTVLGLVTTNDSARPVAEVVPAALELGQRCRAAGSEFVFLEELPRSTVQDNIAAINDALRQAVKVGDVTGRYHLCRLHSTFSGATGAWADGANTSDGLHPSDLGHQRVADAVHTFLTQVPFQLTAGVALAATDTDATNMVAHPMMLTGSAGSGGTVANGWTCVPFFSTNTVPGIEAPAADDAIQGQFVTITATAGATGNMALYQDVATMAIGDKPYIAARVIGTGLTGGAVATVQFLTGSFTIDLCYQASQDFDMTFMVCTAAITATTLSRLQIQLIPNGGAGKIMVAQPIIQNQTALGRTP